MKKFCLCIALLFIGALVIGCAPDSGNSSGTYPDASNISSDDVDTVKALITTMALADYDVLDMGSEDTPPVSLGTTNLSRAAGDYTVAITSELSATVTFLDVDDNICVLNPSYTLTEDGDIILYSTKDVTDENTSTVGTLLDATNPAAYSEDTITTYYFPTVWYQLGLSFALSTTPIESPVAKNIGYAMDAYDNAYLGDSYADTIGPSTAFNSTAEAGWGSFTDTDLETMWTNITAYPPGGPEELIGFKLEKAKLPLITKWPKSMEIQLKGFLYNGRVSNGLITVTYNTDILATIGMGSSGPTIIAGLMGAPWGATAPHAQAMAFAGLASAVTGTMPIDEVDLTSLGAGVIYPVATVSIPTLTLWFTESTATVDGTGVIITNTAAELGSDFICNDVSADTDATFTITHYKDYNNNDIMEAGEELGKSVNISFSKDGEVEAVFVGIGSETDPQANLKTYGKLVYDMTAREGIMSVYDGGGQVIGTYDIGNLYNPTSQ